MPTFSAERTKARATGARGLDGAYDLSSAEWDEMFNAVKSRLRLSVGSGGDGRMAANVLDCVDALDLLHALLQLERSRPEAAQDADGR